MVPLRKTSGFFLVCFLIYALLTAPWPGLMDGYRAIFRGAGNALFHSFAHHRASVSFEPLSSRDHVKDTTLVLLKRWPFVQRGELDITSVNVGYRPMAFLVALVLATPIPWSRRARALAWGLVGINLFVVLRVWLMLLDTFSNGNALAVYSLGPFWKGLLTPLVLVVFRAPATHYTAPLFIWLLVTFRRDDLAAILTNRRAPRKAKVKRSR